MLPDEPMYQLADRDDCKGHVFLRLLMERTGNSRKVNVRDLAEAVGVSHSTIGNLLTGTRNKLPHMQASRAARRLGVDLGVLWEEAGRSAEALAESPKRDGAMV
ncbi:helix-turn-helix transcriptional regulator [Streptomyces sp. NPDC047070]|uniref:helix-turn-helix domain-containing protein n=1 Tax=Streptomyces sp. NPDC047070 TaxID=3154923 RepID=UPI00345416F5